MAKRICQIQKTGKQNIKQPVMTNNLLTDPVLFLFLHNTDGRNIDTTLNSSSTNTMSSTITAAVKEEPDDTIEEYFPNNKKSDHDSIQNTDVVDDAQYFGTERENNHSFISLINQKFIETTPTYKSFSRTCTCQSKTFSTKKITLLLMLHNVPNHTRVYQGD